MPEEHSSYNPPVTKSMEDLMTGQQPAGISTADRQFPINPSKRSKKKHHSSKRPVVIAQTDTHGRCACLRDKYRSEANCKSRLRVGSVKDKECFAVDELELYQKNYFYRYMIAGAIFGSALYLMVLLFLILPERYSKFDALGDSEVARSYVPIGLIVIIVTTALRMGTVIYLNVYLVLALQVATLLLTLIGNYVYVCDNFYSRAPVVGVGGIPMLVIGLIQELFASEADRLTKVLYDGRCLQSIVRLCTVNLVSDVICCAFSIRLLFI